LISFNAPAAADVSAPDLSLGIKATRMQTDTARPERSVKFEIMARWQEAVGTELEPSRQATALKHESCLGWTGTVALA